MIHRSYILIEIQSQIDFRSLLEELMLFIFHLTKTHFVKEVKILVINNLFFQFAFCSPTRTQILLSVLSIDHLLQRPICFTSLHRYFCAFYPCSICDQRWMLAGFAAQKRFIPFSRCSIGKKMSAKLLFQIIFPLQIACLSGKKCIKFVVLFSRFLLVQISNMYFIRALVFNPSYSKFSQKV